MNPPDPLTTGQAMLDLEALMARLRGPDGCPWDREQTPLSLLPFTLEEAYEVLEAVERGSDADLREELGDLLFHVVFYSRMAHEEGRFSLTDVITGVTRKMVHRHPHVFGDLDLKSAAEVVHNWEALKKGEKAARATPEEAPPSLFHGLSSKMPALLWAYKVQQKMHKAGFDWNDPGAVVAKVREELEELDEARQEKAVEAMEEELGDLLFTMVNLARQLHINPETALRRATLKFQGRFRYMEQRLHQRGAQVEGTPLEQLEALWQESKRAEKKPL